MVSANPANAPAPPPGGAARHREQHQGGARVQSRTPTPQAERVNLLSVQSHGHSAVPVLSTLVGGESAVSRLRSRQKLGHDRVGNVVSRFLGPWRSPSRPGLQCFAGLPSLGVNQPGEPPLARTPVPTDRAAEAAAAAIYGAVVAQARAPALYARLGVPDSVTGRFEMVVLHTVLTIDRLKRDGERGGALGQHVFDDFCRDMDQSLRELGFGDMAVPKRMKKLGESFYGRAEAYGRRSATGRAGGGDRAQRVSRQGRGGVCRPAGRLCRGRSSQRLPTRRWRTRRRQSRVSRSGGFRGGRSMSDKAIISRMLDAAHLPATGVEMEVGAGDAERAALAAAYDLVAVKGLSADGDGDARQQGIGQVEGRVIADIVQSCVVSLEPVAQHIDEAFSVRFVPPGSPDAAAPKPGKEVIIDPEAPDPPEVMEGTRIDVGALVEEMFVLAIDPYPRAPGAGLPADVEEPPKRAKNPRLPCCATRSDARIEPSECRRRGLCLACGSL